MPHPTRIYASRLCQPAPLRRFAVSSKKRPRQPEMSRNCNAARCNLRSPVDLEFDVQFAGGMASVFMLARLV